MPFWSKGKAARRFRLFFATDVHGSEPTFRKFINAGKFYDVDVLVLGGDITGKMLIPIIALGNNTYRATLQSQVHHLQKDDLPEFMARLAKLGFYSSEMSESEYAGLTADPDRIEPPVPGKSQPTPDRLDRLGGRQAGREQPALLCHRWKRRSRSSDPDLEPGGKRTGHSLRGKTGVVER